MIWVRRNVMLVLVLLILQGAVVFGAGVWGMMCPAKDLRPLV